MTDQTETLRAALDTMPGLFGGINTPNGLHPDFTLGIAEYLVATALATPPAAGLDVERLARTPIFRRIVDDTGTLESYTEVAALVAAEYAEASDD